MKTLLNVTFLLFYCSLIFWLSSRSSLPTPNLFPHQDKILHLAAYSVMGILAWRVFNQHLSNPHYIYWISISYCSLYGLSDEWHQSWVPGRDADSLDWVADTIGAALAITPIYLKKIIRNLKKKPVKKLA